SCGNFPAPDPPRRAAATAPVRGRLPGRGLRERRARSRGRGSTMLIGLRVFTGAALAWVYPTGMKVAAGWFEARRGAALGVLIGALTIGSAFPRLLASAS